MKSQLSRSQRIRYRLEVTFYSIRHWIKEHLKQLPWLYLIFLIGLAVYSRSNVPHVEVGYAAPAIIDTATLPQKIESSVEAQQPVESVRALEAPKPPLSPKQSPMPPGSHQDWLAAAGIPQSDWWAAELLVRKESGWNPLAVNRYSGACSLAQALPCSKISGDWRDPINALRWMDSYCRSRYGGWSQAWSFWLSHHYY